MKKTFTAILFIIPLALLCLCACSTAKNVSGDEAWGKIGTIRPYFENEKKLLKQNKGYQIVSGTVVGISNGDTITVLEKEKVQHRIRLAGIDAPEKSQDFGAAAKESLSKLIFKTTVDVAWKKKDQDGLLIGEIEHKGRDINLLQIENGMAWADRDYLKELPPEKKKLYLQAEQLARSSKRGLWQKPGYKPPWEFRRSKR